MSDGESHLVKPNEAAEMLGISRTTLYGLEQADKDFPVRVQITERRGGWIRSEFKEYIESKKRKGVVH